MKQRMSSIGSSNTTALTTLMNQPCVAKLGCTSVTPSVGKEEGDGKKTEYVFFVIGKPDESTRGVEWIKKGGRNKIKEGEESRAKERDSIMHSDRMAFSLGNQRKQHNTPNKHE